MHKSSEVRRWVKGTGGSIELYYLPGYSPELNPDEYLNQDVKSNAVGTVRSSTRTEVTSNVRGYLRSTQRTKGVVVKYFEDEKVRYAAM